MRDNDPSARRRRWQTGCQGKVGFDTAALAHKVQERRTTRGAQGKVYRCKGCKKYHIGSPSPTPPKPKNARPRHDDDYDDEV